MARKVFHSDLFPVADHDRPLNHVLQFPDVSGEIELLEFFQRSRIDGNQRFVHLCAIFPDKIACQQGNIRLPFPERRKVNIDHIQPVVKVLPERAGFHQAFQVLVGGTDHPEVGRDLFVPANPDEGLGFQHAQQLHLHLGRNGSDLVEEYRAIVGHFEPAFPVIHGSCEGPFFVTEQFTLQQAFSQRSAMNAHKRKEFSWRVRVYGPCNQLLACTAFSGDDHR